jgi:hypothetical protein
MQICMYVFCRIWLCEYNFFFSLQLADKMKKPVWKKRHSPLSPGGWECVHFVPKDLRHRTRHIHFVAETTGQPSKNETYIQF